jgi:hypothetical protein
MHRKEADSLGRDFIIESLRSFASRDGNDKSKRLKFDGLELPRSGYELVIVRELSPALFEVISHHWTGSQYKRVGPAVTIKGDLPAGQFMLAIDEAFPNVNRPHSS